MPPVAPLISPLLVIRPRDEAFTFRPMPLLELLMIVPVLTMAATVPELAIPPAAPAPPTATMRPELVMVPAWPPETRKMPRVLPDRVPVFVSVPTDPVAAM